MANPDLPGPLVKGTTTARILAKKRTRKLASERELAEKALVRKRDKTCRFPLCSCQRDHIRLRLEVAHHIHKGMGGNISGERSKRAGMVLLCEHRHRRAPVSLDKGTVRVTFLSPRGFDGAVRWEVDVNACSSERYAAGSSWVVVAEELSPGRLDATKTVTTILRRLAELDL